MLHATCPREECDFAGSFYSKGPVSLRDPQVPSSRPEEESMGGPVSREQRGFWENTFPVIKKRHPLDILV